MVFEKSLTAMVKGIRAHRGKETEYINMCLQEIQKEVTSKNMSTKSMAILKLAYLTMFGYDMSWSTFAIVEVMSHNRFAIKRPGYLASAMSFTDSTDVGLLTINLFKKDFGGKSQYETGLAISCLSSICTPEICRDVIGDLMAMLSSSRAYLRKKTVLCLYRIFLKDPPALRTCFPKLKERLGDEDQGVLTASVNTFLELARKNAKNYLSLVPQLYHILVNTSNNWCSIKLMKLFQLLCPWEPRLPTKLVEPLTNLLNTTKAQSVEMEAIRCVLRTMPEGSAITALAIEKNQAMLNSSDRNLRFLALEMFKEILEKPQFRDKIDMTDLHSRVLTCIEESDTTARKLALQLLDRILTPATFMDAVRQLLEFSKKTCPPDEFFGTILRIGSRDRYALVEDFEWYVFVLAEIARSPDSTYAGQAASQFSDILARVPQVRSYAVTLALCLLDRSSSGSSSSSTSGAGGNAATAPNEVPGMASAAKEATSETATPMIGACAWVIGEYNDAFESPAETSFVVGVKALLAKSILSLEPAVQTQCIWAATKLYVGSPKLGAPAVVVQLHDLLTSHLPHFVQSTHVDVSERATLALHLAMSFRSDITEVEAGGPLFGDPLQPVNPEAQKSVPIPMELGLDEPFFPVEEPVPGTFAPVRADPADPYSLAATYKDDFGFLASKEVPLPAAPVPAGDTSTSMFYLQSREQQGGDEQPGAAPTAAAAGAVSADPLEHLRERISARAAGATGTKYQVLRDEIQAPSTSSVPGAAGAAAPALASSGGGAPVGISVLSIPPEKELVELQSKLWSLCYGDNHVRVIMCVKSKNSRKQLLRLVLRCECIGGQDAGTSVSDVKLGFPAQVAVQEADAEGFVSLAAGQLQERSAKTVVHLPLGVFLAPAACRLHCRLQYSTCHQGTSSLATGTVELDLPATSFLEPSVMTEDEISSYLQEHSGEMQQAGQNLSLSAPSRSMEALRTELPAIVGRGAGLCHFHGIQQSLGTSQSDTQKFLLSAQGPVGEHSALPGQTALPAHARVICLCNCSVKEGMLDLKVKVKACRRDVCEDTSSNLATVFRELIEGRLA